MNRPRSRPLPAGGDDSSSRPVRAAGVLLITDREPRQFLLMRHADRWDLPKGHCDGEETFEQAARRELAEETGLDPERCRFDPDFHFDLHYNVRYHRDGGQTRRKHVRYFLASVPQTATIEPTEHESFRWWDWDPPHTIQTQTVDPLLAAVAAHFDTKAP